MAACRVSGMSISVLWSFIPSLDECKRSEELEDCASLILSEDEDDIEEALRRLEVSLRGNVGDPDPMEGTDCLRPYDMGGTGSSSVGVVGIEFTPWVLL